MKNDNFWLDVLRYGAVIGAVSIAFDIMALYKQNFLLSLVSITVFVLMLYYFTKRRVALYATAEEGYSYGRCLGFMVCMMLVAGVLEGSYMIIAVEWLFTERYQEAMSLSITALESTGFYQSNQLELMVQMMQSPLILLLGALLGSVLKGAFFGLFVAAITKREADIFGGENQENQ